MSGSGGGDSSYTTPSVGGTGWGAGVGALVSRIHGRRNSHRATRAQEDAQLHDSTFVQRRVADAQAAGIHPLFALGANAPSSSPIAIDGGDGGAAHIAEAVNSVVNSKSERQAADMDRRLKEAQLDVLKSEAARNHADAASTLARSAQMSNYLRPTPGDVITPKGQVEPPYHQVEKFRTPFGTIRADKGNADAEEIERRYGDIGEEVFGLSLLLSDVVKTMQSGYGDVLGEGVRAGAYRGRDVGRAGRVPARFRRSVR